MNTFQQIIGALYVALAEAAGGPVALRVANQVLRDAIADGAVDDPTAIELLGSLAYDQDDCDEEFAWWNEVASRQPLRVVGGRA